MKYFPCFVILLFKFTCVCLWVYRSMVLFLFFIFKDLKLFHYFSVTSTFVLE